MDKDLSEMFRILIREHRMQLQNFLRDYNIYLGQHRVLFTLQANPNITLTHLADLLDVSKESLSVSLKRLANGGLITRAVDVEDRRRYVLNLSDEGLAVSRACKKGFNDINERLFSSLNDEEKGVMAHLFERMVKDMREDN